VKYSTDARAVADLAVAGRQLDIEARAVAGLIFFRHQDLAMRLVGAADRFRAAYAAIQNERVSKARR
jgi:hypothetical protein